MPKQLNIWSYNAASEGAKNLAEALGAKRIRRERSAYVPRKDKYIINWGDSVNFPKYLLDSKVLNSPFVVGAVSNKIKFFELMEGDCRLPPWTTDINVARGWLRENKTVVARTVLTGHSGRGIIIVSPDKDDAVELPRAPLYTQYVPKRDEYRVHFANGKIIDVQQKKKRHGVDADKVNYQIRNYANGFVYARENVVLPDDVAAQAEAVIKGCGLDFGAIDLIYNSRQQQAYVLEVNTAPGLEGQTVEAYAAAFKELVA